MSRLSRSAFTHSAALRRPKPGVGRQGFFTYAFGSPSIVGKPRRFVMLLVLSGFAGGATAVVVGGYAFYHWSGIKTAVDGIRRSVGGFKQNTQPKGSADPPAGPIPVLAALRQVAKDSVAAIPGAGFFVGLAFNEIEKVVEDHKAKAGAILNDALRQVQEVVRARGADLDGAAQDVLDVLRVKLGEIQALAGQDTIGPIFNHLPQHVSDHVLPVLQKGLEMANNAISDVSKLLHPAPPEVASTPSPAVEATSDAHAQTEEPEEPEEPAEDVPSSQSPGKAL